MVSVSRLACCTLIRSLKQDIMDSAYESQQNLDPVHTCITSIRLLDSEKLVADMHKLHLHCVGQNRAKNNSFSMLPVVNKNYAITNILYIHSSPESVFPSACMLKKLCFFQGCSFLKYCSIYSRKTVLVACTQINSMPFLKLTKRRNFLEGKILLGQKVSQFKVKPCCCISINSKESSCNWCIMLIIRALCFLEEIHGLLMHFCNCMSHL